LARRSLPAPRFHHLQSHVELQQSISVVFPPAPQSLRSQAKAPCDVFRLSTSSTLLPSGLSEGRGGECLDTVTLAMVFFLLSFPWFPRLENDYCSYGKSSCPLSLRYCIALPDSPRTISIGGSTPLNRPGCTLCESRSSNLWYNVEKGICCTDMVLREDDTAREVCSKQGTHLP